MIPYILILISLGIVVVSFLRRFEIIGPSDWFGYSANGILLHGIGFAFFGFYLKIDSSQLKSNAQKLLAILENDPYQTPPPFEKLTGDLSGACSRRINIQHRLVYQLLEKERIVKVLRVWTHYE